MRSILILMAMAVGLGVLAAAGAWAGDGDGGGGERVVWTNPDGWRFVGRGWMNAVLLDVPIRLTLTPDSGPRIVIDTNIVNTAQNPATLIIPVGLPVNNLTTIHAWPR